MEQLEVTVTIRVGKIGSKSGVTIDSTGTFDVGAPFDAGLTEVVAGVKDAMIAELAKIDPPPAQ